ncbi:bifunctional phosphoserine phosphatase/homoserine phosphotransferase ThrH [Brytella acorum]|uniref:phosphoserine phosphatase n=1 Tax=Brytella acorum TaxID=2959299 RepID=A0AA35UI95_9PROT|nr:bifunctional phosphoserine phosphatase/homoserine phosphotransferase ThrH [Brytella acorum]CAI9121955.1 bifunctional phosphoserine phosphatase/homoserine phosphotransferase ThrH [Brytella acorum]
MKQDKKVFLDLEGVLAPEMWPYLGRKFGLDALMATTREEPDYRHLMTQRVEALNAHDISMTAIQDAIAALPLFDGAVDFVKSLAREMSVILVTDSFRPMNEPYIRELRPDGVFCHSFLLDDRDRIVGFDFWNDLRGKHEAVSAWGPPAAMTLAAGDAFNDLTLLRAVDRGILFRPSRATQAAATDLLWVSTYEELLGLFMAEYDATAIVRAIPSQKHTCLTSEIRQA